MHSLPDTIFCALPISALRELRVGSSMVVVLVRVGVSDRKHTQVMTVYYDQWYNRIKVSKCEMLWEHRDDTKPSSLKKRSMK